MNNSNDSLVKKRIEKEYKEYLDKGYCERAKVLNEVMGKKFFDEKNPHYFTGKLDGKVVAVNLNPKRDLSDRKDRVIYDNFEKFWDFYEKFGEHRYGLNSNRKADSKFDNKQVKFYKGAGLLNLKEKEENANDKFSNLKLIFENKLQWELIPFGSPDFTFGKIGIENIKPFLNEALEVATLYPREYIFFNGAVFRDLLSFDNVKMVSKHHFKLKKKDGTDTKKEDYEIINILINGNVKAAILSHYAFFNTPLPDYGKKVVDLYHK